MSNLADLITNVDEIISPSIFNAKTIWNTSGTNLANHDINQDVGAVTINEAGSGFLLDHMYIRKSDKSGWTDVFKQHFHTSDEDGGSFYDIKKAIAKQILEFNFQNFKKEYFILTGGGTATNNFDNTATTSTQSFTDLVSATGLVPANLWAGGVRLAFENPFTLQCKYKIFESTNVIWRVGCGMSLVETSGNQNQVGFEGCLNTDTRTSVVSGDGTSRFPAYMSASLQSNPTGLRLDYYPNDKIVGVDAIGGMVTKTDTLPLTSAATLSTNTLRVGVKSTNDSAGDSRTLRMYGAYLLGYLYDSKSGVGAWI